MLFAAGFKSIFHRSGACLGTAAISASRMGCYGMLVHLVLSCLILITLATVAPDDAHAQTMQFDRVSVDAGLSQSAVNAMVQDRYGFLWIGTQDGLNRWDGYEFRQYRNESGDSLSLPMDWISALAEDVDGRLWIGTHGGGLARLDPVSGTFKTWTHDEGDPGSLADDVVTDILVSSNGFVWIATYGGISRYSEATSDFVRYTAGARSLQNARVMVITEGPHGDIWAGTDRGGLSRFDPEKDTFPRFDIAISGPGSDIVLSVLDEGPVLWVGTAGQGLKRIDKAEHTVTSYRSRPFDSARSSERILSLTRTHDGVLLAGTDGAGLGVVDEDTGILRIQGAHPLRPYALRNGTIPVLFEDGTGDLWVGSTGGGMHRRRVIEHYLATTEKTRSITDNHVLALYEDPAGTIWVGSNGGGLDRVDPKTGSVQHYTNRPGVPTTISHDRVMDIAPAGDGTLWVATGGGLNSFDPRTGRFTRFLSMGQPGDLSDNRVFVARASIGDANRLWVGTWSGFDVMDVNAGVFKTFLTDPNDAASISNNRVISLAESPDGRVWIGTMGGGLNLFDPESESFEHYGSADGSLSNDIVADILVDSQDRVWVATASGLNRFDATTSRFEVISGRPDETTYALEEDASGQIWMSTNSGLTALDPETHTVRTLDVSDGLQSNEFNQGASYKAASGALLFGGVNGFNRIESDRVFPSSGSEMRLTLVQTSKKAWPVTALPRLDHIDIDPDDPDLSIEFAQLNYRNASRAEYEIFLSGVDRDWHSLPSKRRFTTYSGLPPGQHTFSVRAHSYGADWSTLSPVVTVTVTPPFQDTIWFRGLLVLGLVGISLAAMSYYHRRQIRVLEQHRADEREIHRRLMESREAERIRLAQDLHDGAIQDLYGVRFKMDTDETSDSVQSVISRLRDICGELRPPVLEAFGLQRAIRTHAESLQDRFSSPVINLTLDDADLNLSASNQLGLFRIYQEAIQNTLKHAGASSVEVSLGDTGGDIVLSVRDDGKGFDVPNSWLHFGRKNHFGLMGLSERVAAMNGHLSVTSDPGSGTLIEVRLPAGPASSDQPLSNAGARAKEGENQSL